MIGSSQIAILVSLLATGIFLLYPTKLPDGVSDPGKLKFCFALRRSLYAVGKVFATLGFCNEATSTMSTVDAFARLLKYRDPNVIVNDIKYEKFDLRVYDPHTRVKPSPVIIFIHGGGYCYGSLDMYHNYVMELARRSKFLVISFGYRLSPKAIFPEQVNDVYNYVLEFMTSTDNAFNVDKTKVILAGDSAGGNIVAVVTQKLVAAGLPPRAQVLVYPLLQFYDFMLPSYQRYLPIWGFGQPNGLLNMVNLYFNFTLDDRLYRNYHLGRYADDATLQSYVNWDYIPAAMRENYVKNQLISDAKLVKKYEIMLTPEASPLLVSDDDLKATPITYIASMEFDPLRDENFIYAQRLSKVGVPVTHDHFDGAYHGVQMFLSFRIKFSYNEKMYNKLVSFLHQNAL